MRAWILAQGTGLYVIIGMTLVGMVGGILGGVFYGRLAREAQVCGTSEYKLLRYIRQKYASYYKLGMQPTDADAMVTRYLSLHKVGLFSLNTYGRVVPFMSVCIVFTGLVTAIYQYQTRHVFLNSVVFVAVALAAAALVNIVGFISGMENKKRIAKAAIIDYLDNYLKNKLDGDYGFREKTTVPQNYEKALKETAAGTAGGRMRQTGSSYMPEKGHRRQTMGAALSADGMEKDAVDARIVEDVLKEFLS